MPLHRLSRLIALAAALPVLSLTLPAATTPPKPISTVAPKHPQELLDKGIDGSATVKFKVNTDGTVSDAVVKEATDPAFGDAAVAAVLQWKLEPAQRDGKPVAITVAQKFNFAVPPEKKLEAVVGRPIFVEPPEGVIPLKKLGKRPRPVIPPRAPYPKSLLGSGKEGVVRVKFVINTDGLPVNPEIVGTKGDDVFAPYAIVAVARAKWDPIEYKGKIVPVSVTLPVRFSEKPPQQRGGQGGGRGRGGRGGGGGGGGPEGE